MPSPTTTEACPPAAASAHRHRPARGPRRAWPPCSLLALGIRARLAVALVLLAALWLLVGWAVS